MEVSGPGDQTVGESWLGRKGLKILISAQSVPGTDVSTSPTEPNARHGGGFQVFHRGPLAVGLVGTVPSLLPGSWAWGCQPLWKKIHWPPFCQSPSLGWHCSAGLPSLESSSYMSRLGLVPLSHAPMVQFLLVTTHPLAVTNQLSPAELMSHGIQPSPVPSTDPATQELICVC